MCPVPEEAPISARILAAAQELRSPRSVRILVVEDDKIMRDLMAMSLRRVGYAVESTADGAVALDWIEREYFDLVMLDVILPDTDGFTLLKEIRSFTDVPVVMLTSMNRSEDIVRGFELGADNYITKPFNFREVEARVNAVLRRALHVLDGDSFGVVEFGDLRLFNDQQQGEIAGQPVELTPNEFTLLRYLALHADRPVSKEELLHEVWGYEAQDNANVVELAVRRLRTKIEEDPSRPERIQTVRGVGYRYVSKETPRSTL